MVAIDVPQADDPSASDVKNVTPRGIHKLRREYLQKSTENHSSVAKSSIAIITAIFVFFPSTHTFIYPPYEFEGLLIPAAIAGILGFVVAGLAIYITNYYGYEDNSFKRTRAGRRYSSYAALLTATLLIVTFAYIVLNVRSDYVSNPEITSLGVEPVPPLADQLVKFSGQARDQDLDSLTWSWRIGRISARGLGRFVEIPGRLGTAYWTASSGRWRVSAVVTDSAGHRSEIESVDFSVSSRPTATQP